MKKTLVFRYILLMLLILSLSVGFIGCDFGDADDAVATEFVFVPATEPPIPHLSVSKTSLVYGNRISFGSYEQNGDESDGKEDILWTVAYAVTSGDTRKAFLISDKCLLIAQYNETREEVTWETSSLRAYLNEEFIADAFSEEEQGYIYPTNIYNLPNTSYGDVDAGEMTLDSVYIPDYSEYADFGLYVSDTSELTAYAKSMASELSDECVYVDNAWWMRNPGSDNLHALNMLNDMQSVFDSGEYVDSYCGVRLAMWVEVG